ncbi:hypothetical protein [Sphingomonas chungangi]|uniref:hypothetical protein n=1 Tax=Sphingomonas chungangi TaxID=2683589 RepID=UPI001FE3FF39|nr:hypothetical protein [Sphingomonas chungangi]
MNGSVSVLRGERSSRWNPAILIAPYVVVVLGRFAIRTPLASAHSLVAILLFLWVMSEAMLMALMFRSTKRPGPDAVIGAFAGAIFTVWLCAPPAAANALKAMPFVAIGLSAVVACHVGWAALRARRILAGSEENLRERWISAISELLPPQLVRLAAAELSVIHMALFRWRGPADVPKGSRGFAYHKHLIPMSVTLLILSTIEIAVYHLLLGHWSRIGTIIMFILSDVGFIYLVGLIKSFRFKPILLTPNGIRVRAGFLIDELIPYEAIKEIGTNFGGDEIRDKATLNAALLAWPNVLLRLASPVGRKSVLKGKRSFTAVAFRLDDPEPFIQILRWRLAT